MADSPLNDALRLFEATESNLVKAEMLMREITDAIPNGIAFGGNPDYEDNCRSYCAFIAAIPSINGWKPDALPLDLDEIAQARLDAQELGEIQSIVSVEKYIEEPLNQIRKYRHLFNEKRRALTRDTIVDLIATIDAILERLKKHLNNNEPSRTIVSDGDFDRLRESVAQTATLLGNNIKMPSRWSDLYRHIRFRTLGDLYDIIELDWPNVKEGILREMYGSKDPIPIGIEDLSLIVNKKPRGPVATKLNWSSLSDEDFERLVFALISSEEGYENPSWLTKTNAPDRGRDLSVFRVYSDPLGGTLRQRVIIQCKHWQSRSVAPSDVAVLKEQMKLWEPPRVDVHVIATTGRFTSDAVALIEKQNQSNDALRIEMWPESHIERLLAGRPAFIAEFRLR